MPSLVMLMRAVEVGCRKWSIFLAKSYVQPYFVGEVCRPLSLSKGKTVNGTKMNYAKIHQVWDIGPRILSFLPLACLTAINFRVEGVAVTLPTPSRPCAYVPGSLITYALDCVGFVSAC